MKKLIISIFAFITGALFLPAFAQPNIPSILADYQLNQFPGSSDYVGSATDPAYSSIAAGTAAFRDKKADLLVSLFTDPDDNACYPGYMKIRVELEVIYRTVTPFGSPGPVTTEYITLETEKSPDLVTRDRERSYKVYSNAYRSDVNILSVTATREDGSVVAPGDIPDDVKVNLELQRTRYYNMGTLSTSILPQLSSTINTYFTRDNVFSIVWTPLSWASEYEVEWTYVNDYASSGGLGSSMPASSLGVQFRNRSSRVRVPATQSSFFIPVIYSRGYICARVRPLTKGGPDLDDDLFGSWSFDSLNTGSYYIDDVPAGSLFAIPLRNDSLINNLNAQYTITFSEDGKILPQGSYADGSLRVRQNNLSVHASMLPGTERNNYGKLGVVTETIYDFLGRPAVSTLPGVTEPGFWYKPNYNLNDSGNKYSYFNFDFDAALPGTCYAEAGGMDTTRGVSMYYSAHNPNKNLQQARLPDAARFPFTRVIYEADNASRPKIQSGVGYEHRIGSGHETRYVYGNPSQTDLNRLFGTDAGYAAYYQKSMITDANGQVSITYSDMAGRTIATSLAGIAPDQLSALLNDEGSEWQNLGEEISEDLLELTAQNIHGNQNLVSADSLGYTVNRYLLVSSEKTYAIDYEFFPEQFSPACVPGFCADCVYDLEISLLDDCGNYRLGNDSLNGPLVLRIPGTALNAACDGPASYSLDTVLTLQPGVYNLLKSIRVNTTLMEAYIDTLMALDTCLLSLNDFYHAPDVSDCFITCDSCLAAIGTLADFTDENLEAFNGDSSAVTMAYNNLKAQCDGLCSDQYKDECSLGREMMLYDVSPLGQYAQHDNGDASAYPLSVLNESNLLPKRDGIQFNNPFGAGNQPGYTVFNQPSATWRNPRYRHPLTGEWRVGYYNSYGTRVRISMFDDGNGNELPALAPGQSAFTDSLTGERYAYPEQLATLDAFLSAWQASFAQSLLVYHPEYFKYEFCSDALSHTTTIDDGSGNPVEVNTYDYAYVLERYTAAQAMSELGITSSMTRPQIISRLLENDPFFTSTANTYAGGNLATTTPALTARMIMLNKLSNFMDGNLLNLDVVSLAYINVNCGIASPPTCVLSVPSVIDLSDPGIQPDQVWRQIAILYAAARHDAMSRAMDIFPKTKRGGIFSDCIGEDLYIYPFNYSSVTIGGQPASPCSLPEYILYRDKAQRYPTLSAMLGAAGFSDPPSPEELDEYALQGGFALTGKCPMQIDFENMLGQLALNGRLSASNLSNLAAGPYLGTTLYNWLDSIGNGYNASISVSAGTIDIIIAGNCTTTLSWPSGAPAGMDWDDVYFITEAHDGKLYGYTGPGPDSYIEIPYTTCLTLSGCSTSTAAVCRPTPEIKELQVLMNALSADGVLWNNSPVSLSSYGPLLGYGLKSVLGDDTAGSYSWVFQTSPAPHFQLSNSVSLAVLSIQLDTGSSSLALPPAQPYTFTNFYQFPAVTGSPAQQAGFSFGAILSDHITPYYIAPGSSEESLFGTLSVSGGLRNAYGSTCDLITDPRCRSAAHEALRTLKELLQTALLSPQLLDDYEGCLTLPAAFNGGAAFDWGDIVSINDAYADMSLAQNEEGSYYAIITVTLSNSDPASFVIQNCSAMRNCDPCAADTCTRAYMEFDLAAYEELNGALPYIPYTIQHTGDCVYFPFDSLQYDSSYASLNDFMEAWAAQLNSRYGSTHGIHAFVYEGRFVIEKSYGYMNTCPCDAYTSVLGNTGSISLVSISESSLCCSPYREDGLPPALPVSVSDPEWDEPLPPLNFDIGCIEPVVPFPTDTIQDPCVSFLMELAAETAYNQYQNYLDSVRNAYRLAYRRKCMQALETFTLTYESDEYHFTLYYYDRAGNLVRTIPPQGVQRIDVSLMSAVNSARDAGTEYKPAHNNGTGDALATRYRYNSLNQPVAQQSPDGGASHFWYDNLGRVLVSQNARQAVLTAPVYSYTRYDGQSRITEVGEMTRTDAFNATQAYLHNPSNAAGFMSAGYTKGDFVQTYYDVAAPGSGYYPAGFFTQQHLRKRVSYTTYQPGSGYAAGNTTYMSASYYSYDYHGNVNDVLQQNNYMPDTDPSDFNYNYRYHRIQYRYDLVSGKVLEVVLNKGRQDQFWHRYGYDEQNRLKEAMTSADGYWFDSDAAYFYYNHGPLARVEYGPYKSQGADYTYTIHGWLKGMNSEQLNPDKDPMQDGKTGSTYQYVGRDEYGLSLLYFQGDYTSISSTHDFLLDIPGAYYGGYDLYNGNIRAMNNSMVYSGNTEALLQVFRYDQLNRISSSRSYMQNTTAASVTDWNPMAGLTDMFRTLYSYDANGNIQELQRYDKGSVQIDRLSYSYTAGSNRLDHVADAIGDGVVNYDFDSNDPGNYRYDAIGNLVQDDKEEIDTILWNVYGKVTAVQRTSGSSRPDLYFTYDAAGRRIAKRVLKPGGGEWTEHYVHDAQGNVLAIYKTVPVEDELEPLEVYLEENILYGSSRLGLWERNKKLTFTAITETIQSVYRGDKRYELSDHLGNVHVVVTDRKQLHCGLEEDVLYPEYYTAEVKNRYDYYPFGMLMEERKYAAPDCRYDIDTSFIATVMDQNFEEDPTLDAWLYVISSVTPNYGSGSMLLDYDQDPLITYWPADEGDRYKVTFSFSFEGDCDSLQVLGNVQNSTTQSYTSGGTYTFDFMVNDVSGGYGVFGFYKDNPDCIVYIHSVKIEQYTTSTQVVCDTDSVAGYRYGFNGQEKIDEQYGIEGTAYDFGARLYDSRLGRWMAVDPLASEYPAVSPYAFALNTPIQAYDPDGRLVIFVNGFRLKAYERYLARLAVASTLPLGVREIAIAKLNKKAPWNTAPLYSKTDHFSYWADVDDKFTSRVGDNNSLYVDGMYTQYSNAQERYNRGVAKATAIIEKIEAGEIELKLGESIKLVGHSHGGWVSIGMADKLQAMGYNVEVVYTKNPHQPNQKVDRWAKSGDFRLVQYSTQTDEVSSKQSGAKKFLIGHSRYGEIEGAEMVRLPDFPEDDLGGHDVYDQINEIEKIPKGADGYVAPRNDNPQ